jgi:hypothetical protein
VTTFAVAAYYLVLSGRRTGIRPSSLMPWGQLALALGVSCVGGALALATIRAIHVERLLALGVGAVVFLLVYLLLGRLLGLITADDLGRLRNWMRRIPGFVRTVEVRED